MIIRMEMVRLFNDNIQAAQKHSLTRNWMRQQQKWDQKVSKTSELLGTDICLKMNRNFTVR